MPSSLIIPLLNPLTYYEESPAATPDYISRHLDEVPFEHTLQNWEEPNFYAQPWQQSDVIVQQIQSTVFPVNMQLVNCYGQTVYTGLFQQKQRNRLNPDLYICEHSLSLADVPEGIYHARLTAGAIKMKTGHLKVRKQLENSLHLAYNHYRFYGDVIFETGLTFFTRVEGALNYKTPASNDTIYEDQRLNATLLNSVPFRIYELILSDAFGIPDYFIDKLNRVLGCSNLRINGRQYTKAAEGARLEDSSLEDYKLRGWRIDMREKLNRASLHVDNDAVQSGSIIIIANSDSKGFGDSNGSTSVVIDVE